MLDRITYSHVFPFDSCVSQLLNSVSYIKMIHIYVYILQVQWGALLQGGSSRIRCSMRLFNTVFSVDLILPIGLGLGVYSASNINEYQNQ
jgi:hypothetical protein